MIQHTLENLIPVLSERLKKPLPGKLSHDEMMATAPSGKRLNFKPVSEPKIGAVLVLLFKIDGVLHFVLTQRPDYNGTHGGQVSFPGGKREQEDKDLFETAVREAEEEIGINRTEVKIVGTLSNYFVAASNHMVLPVVGYMEGVPTFVADPYEVAEVLTVPLNHLMDHERQKTTILEVGAAKYRLNAPYFDLSDKVVWGATAGMLNELRHILEEI